MPVFDTDERWLRAAIESVRAQVYPDWELCIVDDGSSAPHIRQVLAEMAGDERIRVRSFPQNRGICAASNEALAMATGPYVGLLDHDDSLAPDALYEVARRLESDPSIDLVYTDSDKKDAHGRRIEPFWKPDWSPDLLLSMNYITHFSVYRRDCMLEAGGFRPGFEGSQDHDLLLRVTESTDRIVHVPYPLYSWRQVPASTAADPAQKPYAHEAGRRAIEEALARRKIAGWVEDGEGGPFRYRVRREIQGTPRVSIVIRGGGRRVQDVRGQTRYPHREVVGGWREASGEYLLLLDDDLQPLEPTWLEALLEHAQRPEVGAVGAKILSSDGTLEQAGLVASGTESIENVFAGLPAAHPGPQGLPHVIRNCAAVTRCVMTRRSLLEDVMGGEVSAAELDLHLCARLRTRGYRILYTPYARLRAAAPRRLDPLVREP